MENMGSGARAVTELDRWAVADCRSAPGGPRVRLACGVLSHGLILIMVAHETLLSFQRLVHPFEIPEIFSLPMDQGDVHYLKWLKEGMEED